MEGLHFATWFSLQVNEWLFKVNFDRRATARGNILKRVPGRNFQEFQRGSILRRGFRSKHSAVYGKDIRPSTNHAGARKIFSFSINQSCAESLHPPDPFDLSSNKRPRLDGRPHP